MIEIRIITNHGAGNEITLDLTEGAQIRATKRLGKTADVQTVTRELTLEQSIPRTPNNRQLLLGEQPGQTAAYRRQLKRAIVTAYGHQVGLTQLRVEGEDYADQTIGATLLGSAWVEDVKAVRVEQLLPYFEDVDTERSAVAARWDDETAEVQVLPAYYGRWFNPDEFDPVQVEDCRVWFNRAHLLRSIFAAAGYAFECEYYETAPHNQRIDYLSGEAWYSYAGKEHPNYAHVGLDGPVALQGDVTLLEMQDIDDPTDRYKNEFGGAFPAEVFHYRLDVDERETVDLLIEGSISVDLPSEGVSHGLVVFLSELSGQTGETTFPQNERVYLQEGEAGTVTVDFRWTLEAATRYSLYGIYVARIDAQGNTLSGYQLNSADVKFRPDTPHLIEGDVFNPAALIDQELDFFEYVKGCAHEINGQFIFNAIARTVTLLPAERDGAVAGFYRENPHDLTGASVLNTLKYDNKRRELRAEQLYGWQKPSGHIKAENLYGLTTTVEGGTPGTTDHRNPVFEPTTTRQRRGAFLLEYYDNEGELAGALGYRTAHYYGRVEQRLNGQALVLNWYGQNLAEVPTAAMVLRAEVEGLEPVAVRYDTEQGHYANQYRWREIVEQAGVPGEVVLSGGQERYDQIDFRNPLLVTTGERTYLVWPTEVSDHPIGTRTPVLVRGLII